MVPTSIPFTVVTLQLLIVPHANDQPTSTTVNVGTCGLSSFTNDDVVGNPNTISYSLVMPHTTNHHPMVTRSKAGIFKPKTYSAVVASPYHTVEPHNVKPAFV